MMRQKKLYDHLSCFMKELSQKKTSKKDKHITQMKSQFQKSLPIVEKVLKSFSASLHIMNTHV